MVLCYDGLMLNKNYIVQNVNISDTLCDAQDFIYKHTGFHVNFITKDFDNSLNSIFTCDNNLMKDPKDPQIKYTSLPILNNIYTKHDMIICNTHA